MGFCSGRPRQQSSGDRCRSSHLSQKGEIEGIYGVGAQVVMRVPKKGGVSDHHRRISGVPEWGMIAQAYDWKVLTVTLHNQTLRVTPAAPIADFLPPR